METPLLPNHIAEYGPVNNTPGYEIQLIMFEPNQFMYFYGQDHIKTHCNNLIYECRTELGEFYKLVHTTAAN